MEIKDDDQRVDIQALMAIQMEMLQENKRLSVLTGWLIAMTGLLVGTSLIALFMV